MNPCQHTPMQRNTHNAQMAIKPYIPSNNPHTNQSHNQETNHARRHDNNKPIISNQGTNQYVINQTCNRTTNQPIGNPTQRWLTTQAKSVNPHINRSHATNQTMMRAINRPPNQPNLRYDTMPQYTHYNPTARISEKQQQPIIQYITTRTKHPTNQTHHSTNSS